MFGVVDGLMSMSLDLYKQQELQDPETGSIKKQFIYYKTIPCYARGVISQTTSRNLDKQTFGNTYSNEQYIEVRTTERLTVREKIKNICDAEGNPIWYELNYPSNTPTVFEVIGSTPITDPFGYVVAYNNSLRRSENQQIDN